MVRRLCGIVFLASEKEREGLTSPGRGRVDTSARDAAGELVGETLGRVQIDGGDSTLRACGSPRSVVQHVNTHAKARNTSEELMRLGLSAHNTEVDLRWLGVLEQALAGQLPSAHDIAQQR